MSLRLLKLSTLVIANPLASTFNMFISTCTFPLTWKLAQLFPICKKGNLHDIVNYRPVSLLPLMSKAMEHTINQQFCMLLVSSSLLHGSQHGFRKKILCSSALLALLNRLFASKNNKQTTAIAALDLSYAFETNTHQL